MDGAGDQRFSRSTFSSDQNSRLCVGDVVDHVEYFLHALVAANDALFGKTLVQLSLELLVFLENLLLRKCTVDRDQNLIIDQGLGHQIKRTGANSLNARVHRGITRHQNHDNIRMMRTAV